MLKFIFASLILLSTLATALPADAQGFYGNPYFNRGTFIDRLVGNGYYGGYYRNYRPWYNTGYYPGNSYWGHHHHHHCGGYAYGGWNNGWGRRWR